MPVKTTVDDTGVVRKVVLVGATGSACVIYTHGATITSWISQGKERLFLSKQAVINGSKAIRGGIPVVFRKLPQHGFARTSTWEFLGHKDSIDGVHARFLLRETKETMSSEWPYKFRLTLTVFLSESSLKVGLMVTNMDEVNIEFTSLLHTYLRTTNINDTELVGLSGCKYVDKILGGSDNSDKEEPLVVTKSEDRVYANAPDLLTVKVKGEKEIITVDKSGFKDYVFWNPWSELAKGMSDFGDSEYQEMLCVEAGAVSAPIVLEPGKEWEGFTTLTVESQ
ncbi:putative glucose-6-phosphate 1-epimerase [Smittium culicis]|uniref:Glucose-6-phosphate 1-epimerase n=2 Tax=Smittium culicis TaxID=133412 RepID=A0A1R1X8H7_9FUNG|nr:putative glucose-6-phosphate 1-epimerase [Smittium culicis]